MTGKTKSTLIPEDIFFKFRLFKLLKGKRFPAGYPSEVLEDDYVFLWVNYHPDFKQHCLTVLKLSLIHI